jgi:hypothetical protein
MEPELVDVYHRRLLDYGVADYSAAACWNDYRIAMLQIPLLTTFGYAFAAATDRGDEMVLTMLARGCDAIRHLETNELIQNSTQTLLHDRPIPDNSAATHAVWLTVVESVGLIGP